MKIIRFTFLLLIIIVVLMGCAVKPPLSGNIMFTANHNWHPVIYLITPGSWSGIGSSYVGTVIDSATIDEKGHFAFPTMPSTPTAQLYQLAIQQKGERYPTRLHNNDPASANYFPIIWKNQEMIRLSADADQFHGTLSIEKPSPENEALLALRDIRVNAALDLANETPHDPSHRSEVLDEEKALLEFQKPLMHFANKTPHLLPALTAIRWISIESDYERIPEFVVDQCKKWQATHADHPWVVQLCAVGNRKKLPVLIGDPIPDFSMPMSTGDTLALRQILGKRLTLLDLWASWCAPCRQQNREVLLPLWERYHVQGFQIIGYALDASPGAWSKAIKSDGADRWLHASDLQGDDAPLLQTLRLNTIPANYLLDADGNVVAKNLHGKELERFVKRYFK